MKKISTLLLALFICLLPVIFPPQSNAQVNYTPCPDSAIGTCYQGGICTQVTVSGVTYNKTVGTCGGGNLGPVQAPPAIQRLNQLAGLHNGTGGTNSIGIIFFLNRIITLINIIAGIFVMFNIISSGWMLMMSWGKSEVYSQIKDKLTYTFIGLAVVAFSYTLAGVLGYIFFQDATAIINPQLCDPARTPEFCKEVL